MKYLNLHIKDIRYDENGKRLKRGCHNKKYIKMVKCLINNVPIDVINGLVKAMADDMDNEILMNQSLMMTEQ